MEARAAALAPPSASPKAVYVAGDIGGTNTRLMLLEANITDSPIVGEPPKVEDHVIFEKIYESTKYASFTAVFQIFLEEVDHGGFPRPVVAAIGVAGPVSLDNTCPMTNIARWPLIDGTETARELGLVQCMLINDFVANGYGILELQEGDYITLQDCPVMPRAPKAVIGAGTGLGEAYLTFNGEEYDVFASEGGHVDFAPRDQEEMDLVYFIRQRLNIDRVSVERVVSGKGIPLIYEFVRERHPSLPSRAETDIQTAKDPSAAITKNGCPGDAKVDACCEKSVGMFVSCYGAEAGNLAVKLLPYAGLYIAGGIAAKIKDCFTRKDDFMRNFLAKGRMRRVLEKVPIFLVTREDLGTIGAKHMGRRMLLAALGKHRSRPSFSA